MYLFLIAIVVLYFASGFWLSFKSEKKYLDFTKKS